MTVLSPDDPGRKTTVPLRMAACFLAIVLLAIPFAAPPAMAATAQLTLSKSGDSITASGTGFPTKTRGTAIMIAGQTVTNRLRSSVTGSFQTTFKITAGYVGQVSVTATAGTVQVSSSMTIEQPPTPSPPPPADSGTTPPPDSGTTPPAGYGVDTAYQPVYDVGVPVGQLTQALLDAKPEGFRFALATGTHRLGATLRPRRNQQLLGFPGAVVSGAKVLAGWVQDGSRWYVTGQTQRLARAASGGYSPCQPDKPLCNSTEDVWFDSRQLAQVSTLTTLAPGKFFFDYANSRIYVADNPTGATVETNLAPRFVMNEGVGGVVVKNLAIEKFGNPGQQAVIHGTGWTVENTEVRENHGTGVTLYGGVLRNSRIIRNGQLGVGGGGTGHLSEHNEIAYNNVQGFNPNWEAGGTKWAHTTGVTVRDNWVHHNYGHSLATDINNYLSTYEGNLIEDNEGVGISHEISYDAIIRNNVIRRNGYGAWNTWFTGGVGISITNSPNVEVHGNTIEDNKGGGVLAVQNTRIGTSQNPDPDGNIPTRGPWQLTNLNVHHNSTRLVGTGAWGNSHVGFDIHPNVPERHSYLTSRNNLFADNTYRVPATPGTAGEWFFYPDAGTDHDPRSFSQWQALGQDAGSGGSITVY